MVALGSAGESACPAAGHLGTRHRGQHGHASLVKQNRGRIEHLSSKTACQGQNGQLKSSAIFG
eukprot:6645325-Pyramimonas_sp.AAC.2